MPLERSNAVLDLSDPNIVLGPHKRRPTERLLENGDPLAPKKKRKDEASPGNTDMAVSNVSADKGKCTLSTTLQPTQLTQSHTMPCARKAVNNGERASIIVDNKEENGKGKHGSNEGETTDKDNDAELGVYSSILIYLY